MPIISHNKVCDLAKLTMLVYEYGNTFVMDNQCTVETFVANLNDESHDIQNETRVKAIKELSTSSPHGYVHKFFSVESTDLQVGITVSESNKRITVVFRGSESKYDWYYDLALLKTKLHDNVYVHGGFHSQLHGDKMYSKLCAEVFELASANRDYEIYITGHSLGAALATLFGYELAREDYLKESKVTVVSFASPRVGNWDFRESFDAQENLTHYRITNDRDVVTAVPMIFFHHVGINIAVSEDECNIYENYAYDTWFRYSLFSCFSVSDHNIDLYHARLLKHKWD